jgi:uncharacterized protein (TIGR03086 family)
MTTFDLEPAARRLAGLVEGVPDEALDGPTACPNYRVGDLVEHIGGLAVAFAAAARKDKGEHTAQAPSGDASRLPADWRQEIPRRLGALAEAWRDPDAWTGMTRVGGVALPGEVAAVVALDELVVHGWDVARATGQPYECDRPSLEIVHGFVQQVAAPEAAVQRDGIFGPVVVVPEEAPLLDRVIGLAGRDPHWCP